ncbi:uncharacterized protein LOC109535123 [Dendroctonus ponderosae]|nr:uncharacterized protein LOC109535123 [Dendroctonus ponderosae]
MNCISFQSRLFAPKPGQIRCCRQSRSNYLFCYISPDFYAPLNSYQENWLLIFCTSLRISSGLEVHLIHFSRCHCWNMKFFVLTSVILLIATLATAEGSNGITILSKILRQYINSLPEDVRLGDGVHIISTRSENDARAFGDDATLIGAVENYLDSHEVRIRLPELMPGEGFGRAFKTAMDEVESKENENEGRGKGGGGGGGGGGGVMLMGLMMGKLMAALGIGGVGLLAMKALMVSALALMLSLIIGLKKLVHHDDDDGGGHHVIHAGHGHEYHRKKREAIEMAYQGWEQYKSL